MFNSLFPAVFIPVISRVRSCAPLLPGWKPSLHNTYLERVIAKRCKVMNKYFLFKLFKDFALFSGSGKSNFVYFCDAFGPGGVGDYEVY